MRNMSEKTIPVLEAFLSILESFADGNRDSVVLCNEDLNAMIGGRPNISFNDKTVLDECNQWCSEHDLPLFTMMLSADKEGTIFDRAACRLAFKNGKLPSTTKMKEAWAAEQAFLAALDPEDIERARESLQEIKDSQKASQKTFSKRALANNRVQEIQAKNLKDWLRRYQEDVLDVKAPGQPLIHNSFMETVEGYKERAWLRWQDELDLGSWSEEAIEPKSIVDRIQSTLSDSDANWITKRFGGFSLENKLSEVPHGISLFEESAFNFYVGNLPACDFFNRMVSLLGKQYAVVSHLMFLKDKGSYVPVKPEVFETGLRNLGVEFYLSGYCSWENYSRFLGYLDRIREMLLDYEPEPTLLDAHSILWLIGSHYWFEGEGAKELETLRKEQARILELAKQIAANAHMGQVDKAGVDYAEHLKSVAAGVSGDTLKAVAWLHDAIEDTEITPEYLIEQEIPLEIVDAVAAMTHRDGESYFDYIARVKQNSLARAVKLADLANNSDLSRLNEITDRDLKRLEKYKNAREILLAREP